MLKVTQIVRFLLERGLRFRNLGVSTSAFGHDFIQTATFSAPVPIYPEGQDPPFSRHFLKDASSHVTEAPASS
jgi:hypothetical protein